jgi:hypothetical protein
MYRINLTIPEKDFLLFLKHGILKRKKSRGISPGFFNCRYVQVLIFFLFCFVGFKQFILNFSRYFFIAGELHGEQSSSGRYGA